MLHTNAQIKRLGDLQEKSLRHICKIKDADYKTLSKETDRDRITLKQSIDPLIRRHYIIAEPVNLQKKKSKLIFRPTQKGLCYSIAFLGVTVEDVVAAHSNPDELKKYGDNVRTMNDPLGFTSVSPVPARRWIEHDLFDDNGRLLMSSTADFYKQNFRISLLEVTKDKRCDLTKLFDPRHIESLKRNVPQEVLKRYREFLTAIRNNIDSSIHLLPE